MSEAIDILSDDFLDEIFNIPYKKPSDKNKDAPDNQADEGAYTDVMSENDNISFEEKAAKVSDSIKKEEILSDNKDDDSINNSNNIEDNIGENYEKTEFMGNEVSDKSFESEKTLDSENKTPSMEESSSKECEEIDDKPDSPLSSKETEIIEHESNEQISIDNRDNVDGHSDDSQDIISNNESNSNITKKHYTSKNLQNNLESCSIERSWNLNCTDEKFSSFYKHKSNFIKQHLTGGKIPVQQYSSEMIDARVDTECEIHDYETIAQKMSLIEQWRNRIAHIRLHVASQIFHFKRGVSHLEGILSNIESRKPVKKQDGLVYEHLNDMTSYYDDLQYLYELSDYILKNLHFSQEVLSRKITMASSAIDKPGSFAVRNPHKKPEHSNDYDNLNVGDNVNDYPQPDTIKEKKLGKWLAG